MLVSTVTKCAQYCLLAYGPQMLFKATYVSCAQEIDAHGLLASLNQLSQVMGGYMSRIQPFQPSAKPQVTSHQQGPVILSAANLKERQSQ